MWINAVGLVAFGLPGILLAQQATQQWSATRDLRIGSVDESTQALTFVGSIVIGPQGHVYVTQNQDRLIRVFDGAGRFMRVIGRQGQGPGEFGFVGSAGFLGDTLWVVDPRLRRVSFFSSDGAFHRSVQLASVAIGPDFGQLVPFRLLPDGTALATASFNASAAASGAVPRIPYLRLDRMGQILDTVIWQPHRTSQLAIRRAGAEFFTSQPFVDDSFVLFDPDGYSLVMIDRAAAERSGQHEFRVTRLGPGGDTLYSRGYRYRPIPIPEALVDSILAQRVRQVMNSPRPFFASAREAEEAFRQALYIPRYMIPVTAARIADDGTLWIRREDSEAAVQTWELHDPRGTVRAVVTLPRGLDVKLINEDFLWGVETDELDVPYIVRYRLQRPR